MRDNVTCVDNTLGGWVVADETAGSQQLIFAGVRTMSDLARLLRQLRRRQARNKGNAEVTYRYLAARTGWSTGSIAAYLGGKALPPTDRFDILVRLLGANPQEQGALATVRDQLDERRRALPRDGSGGPSAPPVPPVGSMDRSLSSEELNATVPASPQADQVDLMTGNTSASATVTPPHPSTLGQAPVPAQLPGTVCDFAGRGRELAFLCTLLDGWQADPPTSPAVLITAVGGIGGVSARLLSLDVLDPVEACELLATRIGEHRMVGAPDAVRDIIAGCAGLPLALVIAAARAVARSHFPLAEIASQLRDGAGSLDAFDNGDITTDVRAVFSWSYQALSQPAARLFRFIGLHPGADISTAAAASLAGMSPERVRRLLAELTRAHLLTEHAPGRYTLHDLLRAYAAEQTNTCDSDATRSTANSGCSTTTCIPDTPRRGSSSRASTRSP